jgi:hypothetical protein
MQHRAKDALIIHRGHFNVEQAGLPAQPWGVEARCCGHEQLARTPDLPVVEDRGELAGRASRTAVRLIGNG